MSNDYQEMRKLLKKKQDEKKSDYRKMLESRGHEFNDDGDIVVDLITDTNVGKKNFGKITYDAYKAVKGNTLDSYKPKNDAEKKVLDGYKQYVGMFTPDVVKSKYDSNKYGKGNIDLTDRPIYVNEDGRISTVNSMSFNEDGKEILVPTIVKDEKGNVKKLTDNEAIEHYHKTGQYLGKFNTVEEANEYAQNLHIEQDTYYGNSIPLAIDVDGKTKNFGNITINARDAIINNKLDSYQPKNEEEKKAIAEYTKFAEEYAKKQREPENLGQGLLHGLGYTVGNVLAGAVDGAMEVGRYGGALFQTALRPFTWGSANKALKDSTEELLNAKSIGDMWKESLESRYRVPDWYRNTVGSASYNVGSLAPAILAEVATLPAGGASPLLEIELAKQAANTGLKGTMSSVSKNIAKSLIKPKTSDIVFGMSAAGNAAQEGYATTGDIGKSLRYGALNGLGEVATEKLFGGIAGTGIGADELIDVSKYLSNIKGVSKLASTKFGKKVLDMAFEGVEEVIMTDLTPWFQRATINPDAEINHFYESKFWKDRGEAFGQGVLLSGIMNASTATINKIGNAKNKIKVINDLNKEVEKVNAILPTDATKFEPLKLNATIEAIEQRNTDIQRVKLIKDINVVSDGINAILNNDNSKIVPLGYGATIDEIKQRQKEIATFGIGYADLMADELVKSNPEVFANIEKTAVGDKYVDIKTGNTFTVVSRDDTKTTVEIETSAGTITRVFPNAQADSFATSTQLINIEDSSKETSSFEDENVANVYNILTGEKLTSKQIDSIISNPIYKEAFSQLTGVKIEGSKAEQRAIVRNWYNDSANVEKLKAENGQATVPDTTDATATKTTATEKVDVTDAEVSDIVNAIDETMTPENKEMVLNAMAKKGHRADTVSFAKSLRKSYKKSGTLGKFADFFTDKGAKVISAIESTLYKTDVTVQTTETVSKDKPKTKAKATPPTEATISEKETVEAQSKMPSVKVGDVYTSNGETFTITDRDNTHTTYTVTNENGNVIRKERVENTNADMNFAKKARLYTGVEVGDTYRNNESGVTYTVVSRDSNETTLRNNQNGKTKIMSNETADSLFAYDDAYTKVKDGNTATTEESSATDNVAVAKDTATTKAKSKAPDLDAEFDNVLRIGSVVEGGKDRIVEFYKGNPSKADALEFLKKEYGMGGRTYIFPGGNLQNSGHVSWNSKGIKLEGRNDNVRLFTWNEVDARLRQLVADGNYLTNETKSKKAASKKETAAEKDKYSLSSMGATFFDNEDITADEFQEMLEDGSYKDYQGYKDYVKACVNVYTQSRGITKLSESNRAEIERQIEGIIKVAIAAKRAGYDIYDDGKARSVKDSKKRLLFSSLEPNSDYITSNDISTICDKRTNFAEIYDDIVKLEESKGVPADKRFFSNVDNYFIIHKIMAEKGLTVPCEECYVESMRKNLAPMANSFIELVTEKNPNNKSNASLYNEKGEIKKNNAKIRDKVIKLCSEADALVKLEDLTIEMLTTADGLAQLRLQAPLLYETFNSYYGQSKPKMPRTATPFRPGELIALLTDNKGKINTSLVNKIKSTGGFRLQSYSDFQIKNYVDVLQVIFEASMLGLNGHAYTKVPAFLEATEGTNLKRNISIFMYDDNGKWVLDKKNSFPMELEDIYALVASDDSGNTSIIAVSQNADMSAWIMANDLVGYGIPFHKSGLKMEVVRGRIVKTPDGREVLGYANQIDHTSQQSEVWKTTLGEKKKENTKVKNPIDIYKFWDFENKDNLSKKELLEKNLKKYIDECNKRNYRPKFRAYLMNNEKVLSDVLRSAKELGFVSQDATVDDISFKYDEYTIPYGYYKFLGDFGMFKPDGTASAIEPLSLENYDFDKAVEFFDDSKTLRENELLQQLENGKVRENYRKMLKDGTLTLEQLDGIIREKRKEVANSIVEGEKYSLADDDTNIDDLTLYDLVKLSDDKIAVLYEALGLDDIFFDELTDSDVEELHGGEYSIDDISEELDVEPEKIEILIRRGGLGTSHIEENRSAVMTQERIDRDIKDSGSTDKTYARKYITRISPEDFIDLTVNASHLNRERFDTEVEGDSGSKMADVDYESALRNSNATPYLSVDRTTGRVIGHNGRHRMRALEMAGIESVEIEVQFYDEDGFLIKYNAETIPDMAISSQFNTAIETHISNIIPLNEAHREEIERNYGEKAHANAGVRYSIDTYAPTFYSQMGKVIDEMKQDKIGANSVVSYLKGRGVKDEEIKWSGIEDFLNGKKSVTKAELQEFVAGSQLQIEETILDNKEDKHLTKWDDYKLDGGSNYREIIFKTPNSTYTNGAMQGHWGEDAKGILAHARVQDFEVNGKKMLFIEEIQSDWHNQGHKVGYTQEGVPDKGVFAEKMAQYDEDFLSSPLAVSLSQKLRDAGYEGVGIDNALSHLLVSQDRLASSIDRLKRNGVEFSDAEIHELTELNRGYDELYKQWESAPVTNTAPDAPFRDNYHEYVLKSIIRMAAEQGYDSIGWTPADVQSARWSEEYAEGYRIEYDQDIPKFLNKYGKKWGAKVGRTPMEIDGVSEIEYFVDDSGNRDYGWSKLFDDILTRNGVVKGQDSHFVAVWTNDTTIKLKNKKDGSYLDEEIHFVSEPASVWSMDITGSMKDSVLYEGQTLYSLEKEGNNNERQVRKDLLSGNSRRTDNESSRKQIERIQEFKQKNKGKTRKERQSFAKELRAKGQTETVITETVDGRDKYTLVNPEAYNDDMKAMVEDAASRGLELGFFIGTAKMKWDTEDGFKTNGIVINGNKILVQYDGIVPPQYIYLHERGHINWNTPEMQAVKERVLNDLTEDEKQTILAMDRYADYMEIYEGDKDLVWEEFVVDMLSGMNTYTANYIDLVADYWYGGESAEGYNPSTYAESIDAGGNKGELTKGEWRGFYDSLGELERGMWFPQTSEGDYIFESDEKLIFTDGDYTNPKVNSVIVFEGLNPNEVELGKEIVYYAAQRGKDSQECYEAVRNVLGQEYVTRTNPYPDRAYQGSKNSGRKGNYSIESDRGIGQEISGTTPKSDVRYSLEGDDVPDFLELWEEYINEYGVIPKGEKPTRDIDVPQKVSDKDVVSRFARTVLEAEVTPDWAVSEFEKAIVNGELTHEVITNKDAHKDAVANIKKLGFEGAMQKWSDIVDTKGEVNEIDFTMALELYNQCITNKDTRNAMKLVAEITAEATRSARKVQLCRLLKTLTPDGQLYYLEKSVQKMNEEFKDQLGDKFKDIELDEGLMEEFFNEKDGEKRDEAYDKICQNIADQMPSTLKDKWDSWRYLAMLGNPRTHFKNIFGNLAFAPAIMMKNYISATIESGLEKAGKLDNAQRTKAFYKNKDAVEFAKKDAEKKEIKKLLQGMSAKYAVTDDIGSKRTIFKGKALKWVEWLRRKNFDLLEWEDWWFLKGHYVDALARLITARNIDVNSVDSKTLQSLREYAINEAQAATFRDTNIVAQELTVLERRLQRRANKGGKGSGWAKAGYYALEGVMPFKGVPTNILKQGINYSPVGLAKGVYDVFVSLKKGEASVTEVVDTLSKGLTGTALLMLGYWLASIGFLSGGDDENKKKREFDEMVGEQSYALGENGSYSMEWATPTNLPMFVGATLYELTRGELKFADAISAMSTITEPMLELSVLSGLSSTIQSAQYNETNPLIAIMTNAFTNYFTQALPTIGGQISRIADDKKREYFYTDKNKNIPKGIQNLMGKVASKTPFASYLFEPSVDNWGRDETYGNAFERVLENAVSPGYYAEKNYTQVDDALKSLYEKTGDAKVFPVTQAKYFTEDSVRYDMTAKEYTEAKKMRGQKSFELVSQLLSDKKSVKLQDNKTNKYKNKTYSQMSDSEKVRAIQRCYEEAGDYTKENMLEKIKSKAK